MSQIKHFIFSIGILFVSGVYANELSPSKPITTNWTYTSTDSTYPTSEGGVWTNVDILHASPQKLKHLYNQGFRIIHSSVCLSDYQVPLAQCPNQYTPAATLPAGLFTALQQALANVRAAGLKLTLRFTYNNPNQHNPSPVGGAEDAPLNIILGHMRELAPTLLANQDVIYTLQTGFIGRWGEWHDSTNGNDTTDVHNLFLQTFFALFGNSTMNLETRYPSDILDYLAYSDQSGPIIGIHDDALVSNPRDEGTYLSRSTTPGVKYTLFQLRHFTLNTAQNFTFDGETTALYPILQNCNTFLAYAAKYHLSGLDIGFYQPVIQSWQQDGCYDQIVAHVGPRLVLQNAALKVAADHQSIDFTFTLKNDGFSRVMSQRPAYLIIYQNLNAGPQKFAVNAQLTVVKLNTLAAGQSMTWHNTLHLANTLSAGDYTAALWLPDANLTLQKDPRYNLLLNNTGVADAQTGLNILGHFEIESQS